MVFLRALFIELDNSLVLEAMFFLWGEEWGEVWVRVWVRCWVECGVG